MLLPTHFRAHPRLLISIGVGIAGALLLPSDIDPVSRGLAGWNIAAWLYLMLVSWSMAHADHQRLRHVAEVQAESMVTVLIVVILAAVVSLGGTVAAMSMAREADGARSLGHIALALATVVSAWLLVPTMFALAYASHYYRTPQGAGLTFPETATGFKPHYGDFLYVAFTIATAAQTSDVCIASRAMRRLVLLQSVVSFAFNTAVLAFTINLAAGMF